MRQTLFGAYLGLLAIVLAIFLFNSSDRLGLTLFCSLGVALGVWIAGCCGEKCCGFLYALVASLSTAFFTIYWTDSHTIRSLLIIAATSALNSNRSLKWKSSRLQSRQNSTYEQVISHKQFMFLVSLFVTTLCINWVCFSRTVLQREIGFVPEGSTIRIKSVEVGTFFADYAFERKKSLHTFYPVADHTIDYIPMLKFGANTSNVPWKNGKKAARNTIHSPNVQLLNLYRTFNVELNFFDDQQRVSEFYWLRCVTVFLTDYTRLNLLNETKKDKTEVLKAALWRLYLIHTFDVDPFTSDRELLQKCKPFQKKSDVSTNHQNKDEKTDWALASKVRACTILTNALRST
ncbi:hypothetical protein M3Y97_00422200 [Aphelenchoides bicaudatus]|nr:hypothetical protein M3Y97_00422200 [Aphelenchoides bicaudatus]